MLAIQFDNAALGPCLWRCNEDDRNVSQPSAKIFLAEDVA